MSGTTLKPETQALITKIQKRIDLKPSTPQVIHAAVKLYAEKLGVEA